MFGLSFGEFFVLIVVAIVVVGPRNLPALLRNLGRLIGKLRRMAVDLRADSGIDEILREEGLREEYENFRRLASGTVPIEDDPYSAAPAPPAAPAVPAAPEVPAAPLAPTVLAAPAAPAAPTTPATPAGASPAPPAPAPAPPAPPRTDPSGARAPTKP